MATKKKDKKPLLLLRRRNDRLDAGVEDTRPTVKRYFVLLGRRFWKLVTLNLMMLPMIMPILIIAYLYLGIDKTPTQSNPVFAQLYGANVIQSTPTSTFMLDLFGAQLEVPVYMDVWTYVLIGVALLFLFVTWGWQNVGSVYVLRSMVRGEPVFTFSDYFYAVKRNLKQGLLMGMLDFAVIVILALDIIYFNSMPSTFLNDFFLFTIIAISLIYFFMRFYLYLLLITFELKIRKILKNALIFVMLGIKRNLMGVLGIILITALNVALLFLFAMTPLGIAIPLILPFLYYLAVTSFTTVYSAYPVIDRYMIAPYRKQREAAEVEEEPTVEEAAEEPVPAEAAEESAPVEDPEA